MVDRSRFIKWSDEEVLAAQERLQNAVAVAKELGIGTTSVRRILAKHGVRSNGLEVYRENATLFKGDIAKEIAAKYAAGAIVADLVKEYGGSFYSVKRAIRSAGGELRDNPAPLPRPGEVEEIVRLYQSGLSQMQVSLRIGRSQAFVSRILRHHGGGHRPKLKGENHPYWKGGRYLDANGYVRAWVAADDPLRSMALNTGHVLEHRLIMARKLGRPLLRSETVHHINGDKLDNRPENLQLRQGKHGKHIAMRCLDCGSHNVGPTPL